MREALHQDVGKPARHKRSSPDASLKNQSVIRAFTILKSFYSPEEWVAASDLARRAQLHEATVNRFMQSLVDVGAVVRDEAGRYRCVLFMMPGVHQATLAGPKNDRRVPRFARRFLSRAFAPAEIASINSAVERRCGAG